MTTEEERKPAFNRAKFHCPYCDVFTHQAWERTKQFQLNGPGTSPVKELWNTTCFNCKKIAVWYREQMIDPIISSAHQPNDNMPDDVKEIYEEARLVSIYSPRAAATLLRVATERLTVHLGETKGKLNTRIETLATKERLDARIIQSLHILRITANEGGAHDGLMDLTGAEGASTVSGLFFAINYIVEKTIGDNARLDQIYGKLPEVKREGVKNRDKPKDKT